MENKTIFTLLTLKIMKWSSMSNLYFEEAKREIEEFEGMKEPKPARVLADISEKLAKAHAYADVCEELQSLIELAEKQSNDE